MLADNGFDPGLHPDDFLKMEFAGSGKPIKLISVDADYSKNLH